MDDLWTKCEEPLTGRTYYFCKEMNVARWDFPKGIMKKSYPGVVKSRSGNQYTCFFARVLYDYHPNHVDLLNICKGDILQVFNMNLSDWSGAINVKNGLHGYVPQSYYAVILPPGDPKPRVESPNRTSCDNRVRMSLTPLDFKPNNVYISSNENRKSTVDGKSTFADCLQRQIKLIETTRTVVARTEVLLYRLYCDGLLNLNSPTPKALTFLEKYRETRKISLEDHYQTLISIGWKVEKYNKLLVTSGVKSPSSSPDQDSISRTLSDRSTPNHQSPLLKTSIPGSSPKKDSSASSSGRHDMDTPYSSLHIKAINPRITRPNSPVPSSISGEIDKYAFSGYASMYFQRDTRKTIFNRSSLFDLYMFSKEIPSLPLNKITGSNEKEAIQLCTTIMIYMNDIPDTQYHNEDYYLSTIQLPVLYSNDLFEEAICFIIKQTNSHPNLAHATKGWELIPYILSVRMLSKENPLYPYMLRYIVNNIYRSDTIGGIALYTFYFLTGVILKYDKAILEYYKLNPLPKGVFGCHIDQVYTFEDLSNRLLQYNLSPINHGTYGSLCHAEVFYTERMAGELSLKFLLRGACLPRKTRINTVFKYKWIWVNPFLTGLCWNRSDTMDNYKKQDFTGFAGVIVGEAPGIKKTITEEYPHYSSRAFSLNFNDVNLTLDLIAGNQLERDRWKYLFQVLYSWYNISGKTLYDSLYNQLSSDDQDNVLKIVRDEDVGYYSKGINSMVKQLKHSFIAYVNNEYQKDSGPLSPQFQTITHHSSCSSLSDSLSHSPMASNGINIPNMSGSLFNSMSSIEIDLGQGTNDSSVNSPSHHQGHKKNSKSDTLLNTHLLQYEESHNPTSSTPNVNTNISSTELNNSVSQLKLGITYPLLDSSQMSISTNNVEDCYRDVPRVLRCLIRQLNHLHAYNNQGIFRIPGSKEQINYYADQLSLGYYEEIDKIVNPDLLAGIVKNWFRSLSDPLIPYSLYDDVINCKTEADVQNVINQLSDRNRICLRYMCRFFLYYITFEPFNQMTKSNFATCISPSLIRCPPAKEIQDTFIAFNHIRIAVQFVIFCLDIYSYELASDPIYESEF